MRSTTAILSKQCARESCSETRNPRRRCQRQEANGRKKRSKKNWFEPKSLTRIKSRAHKLEQISSFQYVKNQIHGHFYVRCAEHTRWKPGCMRVRYACGTLRKLTIHFTNGPIPCLHFLCNRYIKLCACVPYQNIRSLFIFRTTKEKKESKSPGKRSNRLAPFK